MNTFQRDCMRAAALAVPVLALAMSVFGDVTPGQAVAGQGAPAQTESAYRGTLTFARDGSGDPFNPQVVVDFDLASDRVAARFNGFDAHRTSSGETAFLQRLSGGYVADFGVVAANARGIPGPPLHVCTRYSFSSNRICHTPKLSPDGQLIAYGIAADGGSVCKNDYGLFWADYVIVTDRTGKERARYEGYYHPEWLPDGRLAVLGSLCRKAGVWLADASLRGLTRIDGDQIATPAAMPAVSPDGTRLALVWNHQLWQLTLDDRRELTQLTQLDKPVSAAAWSPDGAALAVLQWDVSMPVKSLVLFRPGDERSLEVRSLSFYPFGPISWH